MIQSHQPDNEFDFKPMRRTLLLIGTIVLISIILMAIRIILIVNKPTIYHKQQVEQFGISDLLPKPDTLHLIRATTYQPTQAQCDYDPLTTADGSRINPDNLQRWVALSRDLLSRWGGQFNYGDTITCYSETHPQVNGDWVVRDAMNKRYTMSIDFLARFDKKLGVGKDVKIIYCGSW